MNSDPIQELARWALTCVNHPLALPDEHTCADQLAKLRFPQGVVCCPGVAPRRESARVWRCTVCWRRISLTADTLLERTRVPLRIWLAAAWYIGRSPSGIAALRFQQIYGLPSYGTVWALFHSIRALLTPTTTSTLECARSVASAIITGRGLRRNRAALTLAVGPGRLRFRVHAHSRALRGPRTHAARVLIESFATWIAGTFHGVSGAYLPLYAAEFFARWSGDDVVIALARCALAA